MAIPNVNYWYDDDGRKIFIGWIRWGIDIVFKGYGDERAEVMKVLRDNNMSECGFENCNTVADIVRELKCDNLQLWADLKLERRKREDLEIKMKMQRKL